jgi:hypothetical protein
LPRLAITRVCAEELVPRIFCSCEIGYAMRGL